MRAPSTLYSKAASPSAAMASSGEPAVSASIGASGRNISMRNALRPVSPFVKAACAAVTSDPPSITARRIDAADTLAALATASITTPSSAP